MYIRSAGRRARAAPAPGGPPCSRQHTEVAVRLWAGAAHHAPEETTSACALAPFAPILHLLHATVYGPLRDRSNWAHGARPPTRAAAGRTRVRPPTSVASEPHGLMASIAGRDSQGPTLSLALSADQAWTHRRLPYEECADQPFIECASSSGPAREAVPGTSLRARGSPGHAADCFITLRIHPPRLRHGTCITHGGIGVRCVTSRPDSVAVITTVPGIVRSSRALLFLNKKQKFDQSK